MKYLVLVGEALADEPVEDLAGRTPLEAAKTPAMDHLAKNGMVGQATHIPLGLPLLPDIACLSVLGWDPKRCYTGVAPLDAAAFGMVQTDAETAFRCDFITVLDGRIVDAAAGKISDGESRVLVEELNRKLSGPGVTFHAGEGYKNILTVSDAELAADLEDLECAVPAALVGEVFSKHLSRGKGSELLREWMEKSREVLENHEINRVRIDLRENPANMIWLWGQGKKPKLRGFEQERGLPALAASEASFARGLGILSGMDTAATLDLAADDHPFVFVFRQAQAGGKPAKDLKDKIKWIEEFDAFVAASVKAAQKKGGVRVLVTTDYPRSLNRQSGDHGHVPFLISGEGVPADASAGPFHEKTASQSTHVLDEGHRLLDLFMKGASGAT